MSEAAPSVDPGLSQALLARRTSSKWLISALPALIIVLAGIIPIILMSRSISNSREIA